MHEDEDYPVGACQVQGLVCLRLGGLSVWARVADVSWLLASGSGKATFAAPCRAHDRGVQNDHARARAGAWQHLHPAGLHQQERKVGGPHRRIEIERQVWHRLLQAAQLVYHHAAALLVTRA